MRVKKSLCVSLLLSSFVLLGCSKDKPKDNILKVAIDSEVSSFDPALVEDGAGFRVAGDLFASIVERTQDNKIEPGIASSWDISKDGRVFVFHLNKNAKFSDGSDITAQDVVYSWQRVVNPKTASSYSYILNDVVNAEDIVAGKLPVKELGVKALDQHTLEVRLNRLDVAFLQILSLSVLAVVSKNNVEKFGSSWTNIDNIVSSGAYKLKRHVTNGYILATKNNNYYNAKHVAIDEVKYIPYIDNNAALNAFYTDNLDLTWKNIPSEQLPKIKTKYSKEFHEWRAEKNDFLFLNNKLDKYKNNPKLRQALNMAIDRKSLVDNVLGGGSQSLSYSIVSATIANKTYANNQFSWHNLPNDERIAMAKKLYLEAGYSESHPLEVVLDYRSNDLYKKTALAVASMLKDNLGVKVTLRSSEWKVWLKRMRAGDYDLAEIGGWNADFDSVDSYTSLFECDSSNNVVFYCNKNYDALIAKAKNAQTNSQQVEFYKQAIDVINNDYPIIPLYQPTFQRLVSQRVQNYQNDDNYIDKVKSEWFSLK